MGKKAGKEEEEEEEAAEEEEELQRNQKLLRCNRGLAFMSCFVLDVMYFPRSCPQENYDLGKELGSGAISVVHLGTSKGPVEVTIAPRGSRSRSTHPESHLHHNQ